MIGRWLLLALPKERAMNSAQNCIIVPAHNEEAVIRATLDSVLKDANPGEFEVLVVCNGCSDRTASIAAEASSDVKAIELEEASKIAAINIGLRFAKGRSVLLLDADIQISTSDARSLLNEVDRVGTEVAIGHMDVDLQGADFMVRAFYRVWQQHPYLKNGEFAAAIALSAEGVDRIGVLPPVTADDTYLKRLFPARLVSVVPAVRFTAKAPRTIQSLIKVRTRSQRGTGQLKEHIEAPAADGTQRTRFIRSLVLSPRLWAAVPVYLAVAVIARIQAVRKPTVRWERDLTARVPVAK